MMPSSASTGAAALEVRSLRKEFGPVNAVQDVSFAVAAGEVLGFLGPNGAGKSTTMKMITGYLPVTSGEIEVGGLDIQLEPIASRRQIGYLPEGLAAPWRDDRSSAARVRRPGARASRQRAAPAHR